MTFDEWWAWWEKEITKLSCFGIVSHELTAKRAWNAAQVEMIEEKIELLKTIEQKINNLTCDGSGFSIKKLDKSFNG